MVMNRLLAWIERASYRRPGLPCTDFIAGAAWSLLWPSAIPVRRAGRREQWLRKWSST